MNRAQVALDLLMKHGTVKNAMIAERFPERVYCWRNCVSEAKKLLPPGFKIVAHMAGEWREHAYELVRPSGQLSLL